MFDHLQIAVSPTYSLADLYKSFNPRPNIWATSVTIVDQRMLVVRPRWLGLLHRQSKL